MGYAILRTQKLKSGQAVRRSLMHAFREQETPNADKDRIGENTHIGAENVREALEKFNARLPRKVRGNAVLAIEYLITGSPDDMKNKSKAEQDAYFEGALGWLKDKHKDENVIYVGIHRDETTPHMYAYIVPLDERGKLNCRAFLGGAKTLSLMQTDFVEKVAKNHGLQRGIEGSRARHITIQQYYARANKAFEPLPEIKTTPLKLRPEPEKPSLFSASDAKEKWRIDHERWLKEKAIVDNQLAQRQREIEAQRNAAVEVAKRHQAQAKEAEALKIQVENLTVASGHYAKKSKDLEGKVNVLSEITNLFTAAEMAAAQERKKRHDAEKARLAEVAKQKAVEEAYQREIEQEKQKRIDRIQKLLQRGGATYTFAVKACEAILNAGDPHKVDWNAVEIFVVNESIGNNGQAWNVVLNVIKEHSPGRADPKSYAEIENFISEIGPQLEKQFELSREQDRDDLNLPRLS